MFDSKNRPGPFDFSVAISGENVASNLSIKGWVEAQELSQKELYPFESGSLRFKTNHLVFGEIFDGTNDTMSTLIYNQSNRVIKFSGPHSQIPAYVKFIPAAMLILPKTEISATLIIDPRMSKKWGPVKDSIVLVSNDIKEPKKNIFFSMNVKEKFPDTKSEKIPVCFIEVPNIELGKVLSTFKEQVRIHITNKGQEILRIRRVFSKCECIKFHSFPAALMPGESGDVVLKLDLTGRSGEFSKEIEIISSDPQNPIQKVSITASVKD